MATDLVCGMRVEPVMAAGHFDYDDVTYYFCSTHCLNRFRGAPEQYVKKGSGAATTDSAPGRRSLPMMQPMENQPAGGGEIDPVCRMTVQPATAAGSHLHQHKTYYFCCQGCLEKFRADPDRYLRPSTATPGTEIGPRGGTPLPMMAPPASSEKTAGVIDPICGM